MGPKTISKTRFNENFEDFLSRYNLEDMWRKRKPEQKAIYIWTKMADYSKPFRLLVWFCKPTQNLWISVIF